MIDRQGTAGINHHDGGRGLCWEGLDGHRLEIITRPYGAADRAGDEES